MDSFSFHRVLPHSDDFVSKFGHRVSLSHRRSSFSQIPPAVYGLAGASLLRRRAPWLGEGGGAALQAPATRELPLPS